MSSRGLLGGSSVSIDVPSTPPRQRGDDAGMAPPSPLARQNTSDLLVARTAEREQRELLTELGFYGGGREALKAASDRTFLLLTGSLEECLPLEKYVEYERMHFGVGTREAAACFHAADLDESGLLNRHEFLLANEAFHHEDTPTNHELLNIRATAVFLTFADGTDGDNPQMTGIGFRNLVNELCKCPEHSAAIMKELIHPEAEAEEGHDNSLEAAAAAVGTLNVTEFRELFTSRRFVEGLQRTRLSRAALLRQLFRGHGEEACGFQTRVVLDDRHEFSRSDDGVDVMRVASAAVPHDAVNPHLELDPRLRVETDWRGPHAAERGSEIFLLASNVINVALAAAHNTFAEGPVRDSEWMTGGGLLEKMLGPSLGDRKQSLSMLATYCQAEVARQPTVVRVSEPVKVFGDVHGQLRDLLLLFREFGMPTHRGGDIECVKYVFNGDFVDRGAHQVEVVALLFALKVMYPSRVFLIRGNHEFRDVNSYMEMNGFEVKLALAFGPDIASELFETVHQCFDWLPLACVVEEKILVLHGGIGAGEWSISELERVQRPIRELELADEDAEPEVARACQMVLEALWSDPSDSDADMRRGVHWGNRGSENIPEFGPDVTEAFCAANGIDIVVRSHQFVARGYKIMHGGHLLTVFSARNYFDREENDGALLLIAKDAEAALRIRPKSLLQDEEAVRW